MQPPRQLLWVPDTGNNKTAAFKGSENYNATVSNPWGPFGNAATYGADMAIVAGILLSGFLLGILLMLVVRHFLRRRRIAREPRAMAAAAVADDVDQKTARGGADAGEKRPTEPPTMYVAGETQLAGAAAECAICLTEFAERDALRVLPACRHGFHVECVERWLASSAGSSRQPFRKARTPSCPVCRVQCLPVGDGEPQPEPAPEP